MEWLDRVATQRQRNYDLRTTGVSNIPDQGVGFNEDRYPVDKESTLRNIWDRGHVNDPPDAFSRFGGIFTTNRALSNHGEPDGASQYGGSAHNHHTHTGSERSGGIGGGGAPPGGNDPPGDNDDNDNDVRKMSLYEMSKLTILYL